MYLKQATNPHVSVWQHSAPHPTPFTSQGGCGRVTYRVPLGKAHFQHPALVQSPWTWVIVSESFPVYSSAPWLACKHPCQNKQSLIGKHALLSLVWWLGNGWIALCSPKLRHLLGKHPARTISCPRGGNTGLNSSLNNWFALKVKLLWHRQVHYWVVSQLLIPAKSPVITRQLKGRRN